MISRPAAITDSSFCNKYAVALDELLISQFLTPVRPRTVLHSVQDPVYVYWAELMNTGVSRVDERDKKRVYLDQYPKTSQSLLFCHYLKA